MTSQPPLLVLRADAAPQTGAGHVMRCLALAQEWRDQGGEAVFAGQISAEPLQQRLEAEGFQVFPINAPCPDHHDLRSLLAFLNDRQEHKGWVVLDGYHFTPAYHQTLRASGWPLTIIDDYAHLPAYHADILVNPNAHADEISYRTDKETLVLRGTRFSLLRKEFRQARACAHGDNEASLRHSRHHLLVTMGGADPDNVTAKVIETLELMNRADLAVKIIVGPLNPHHQALNALLRRTSLEAEILSPVTDMVPLLRWADLAISAAGSTCWELAALGVPMAVTILAANQKGVAESLTKHGAAINLGWHHAWRNEDAARVLTDLSENGPTRRVMSEQGRRLVDGLGCQRLTKAMGGFHLSLRVATEDDCETVFHWANDPLTRAVSFSHEIISWQDHCCWFAARLADHDHLFYVAISPQGAPMAQARFALTPNQGAIISVSLAHDFRGLGLGPRLIRLACHRAMKERSLKTIRALIRHDNLSSVHAFTHAGFRQSGFVEILEQKAVDMTYSLEEAA